jgi:tetratricopeptide (TPR) repeat protein
LEAETDLLWARWIDGRPVAVPHRAEGSPAEQVRADLLNVIILAGKGRIHEAAAAWRRTWSEWAQLDCVAFGSSAAAQRLTERLRQTDTRLLEGAAELLAPWPPAERRRLQDALVRTLQATEAFQSQATRRIYVDTAMDRLYDEENLWTLQGQGRYAQAREILVRIARDHPAAAKPRSDLGVVDALMGRPARAILDLEAAIKLDDGFLPAYLTLGGLYAGQGRTERAIRTYARALARPPDPADERLWRMILDAKPELSRR